MTQEEKAKAYDEALERARVWKEKSGMPKNKQGILDDIFPELKESDDEKIRKALVEMVHDTTGDSFWVDYNVHKEEALAWLEKQGTPAKLSEEEQNKFAKVVLRSCAMSFIDYLDAHKYEGKMCVSNGECEDIENAFHNAMWDRLHRYYCKYIEKQGEQKASYTTIAETGNGGINALVTGELSNSCDYEDKPADKVEPKFRVKYAGSEYNVLEIKEIAGDTYYGIEDEPNHIDYVLPDNCEIVSEQKSWSEEDDDDAWMNDIISKVENNLQLNKAEIDWLKSLRPQLKQKWSEEDA